MSKTMMADLVANKVIYRTYEGVTIVLDEKTVALDFGTSAADILSQLDVEADGDINDFWLANVHLEFGHDELSFVEVPTSAEDSPVIELLDASGKTLISGRPTAEQIFGALGAAVTSDGTDIANEPVWPELGFLGYRETNPDELREDADEEEMEEEWWQEELALAEYFQSFAHARRSYIASNHDIYLPDSYDFD
ncbi:hypothetical protein [Flaviflexus sp.]|uniref:hypothetical protein n=1 Tax=Flaviflexus sp. TaxID=1969482 RepID=UPI003F8ECF51